MASIPPYFDRLRPLCAGDAVLVRDRTSGLNLALRHWRAAVDEYGHYSFAVAL
jgi:hypothetical protein